MIGLTQKQADCLSAVKSLTVDGVAPSLEELREALGLNSKCGVHRLLTSLEERGFIRRVKYRARAIEVIARDGSKEARAQIADAVLMGLSNHVTTQGDEVFVVARWAAIRDIVLGATA